MKIIIDQAEINSAVACYLAKQGVDVDSYDLDIDVTAGRGDSGPRIEIDMTQKPVDDTPMELTPKPTVAPFGSTSRTVTEPEED